MVITSATAMWLPFTKVSIKLQDTQTLIHHKLLEFIKVKIVLRSEEAMFGNCQCLSSTEKYFCFGERI